MFERLKYWIWLSSLDSMSPKKLNRLIEEFSDPINLWHCSFRELKALTYLNDNNLNQLADKQRKDNALNYLEELIKKNIRIITIKDKEYPVSLKSIYDPPVILYVRGKTISEEKSISIVGSRNASEYGRKSAYRLAFELALTGFTIISGMAKGIDTYAHMGALEAGGRTIAVLGCGIDKIYPPENKELSIKIENTGAVISEYLPGNKPMPYNFPARNRIISGMSMGTIIVEAGEKSGSLITANYALDQGREVFAVPGNIDSINSNGTNKLIKDGAKMVTNIDDVLEEFGLTAVGNTFSTNKETVLSGSLLFPPGITDEEKALLTCIAQDRIHIDVIAEKCAMDSARVCAMLTLLELSGFVEQLSGKYYKLSEELFCR